MIKDDNTNLASTYCNNCDYFCRLEAFKIRSLDSTYYHHDCSHTYWIGLRNRIVFSDYLDHHNKKENNVCSYLS